MTFSVDPMDVVLPLLRDGLGPDVHVFANIPDDLTRFCPLVVCRRSGGASVAPEFHDLVYLNVQTWAAGSPAVDANRAAALLADAARGVLWTAWRNQTGTEAGHVARIRESLGPHESTDADLPHFGRYQATYELLIRKSRVLAAP